MDSMFKIECNGEFREGRALALLSSMVTHNIQNIDMAIISSDGVTIPANRGVLALQSKYIAKVLESVPCCQRTSVSLPFSAVIVKNLLAVISCGSSLPMAGEDLLNVKVAADVLEIKLGQLEVEKSDAKPVKKTSKKRKRQADDALHSATASPQPYYQNDNDRDSDEIVEITPEIFQPDDQEDEGFAPHFLMQAEYGEDTSSGVSSPMSGAGVWQIENNTPELIVIEPEEGGDGEKKFKCSFCPNKIFKKKPEIMRHFKKHIPLSQRKRFQCESCKEKFISNSNLKTHQKVCTGKAKTFTCKRCKSEFNNKTDYEDHMAESHNVGRNHECHICHKQMRRAGDVKKHMLTHSEGKPFECDICGKKFRTESYVKVHKEAHYKNGTTPVKQDPRDTENEPKSEGIYNEEAENTYNEDDDFDHEAVESMEDEDQEHFTSELDTQVDGKEEKLNYSMNQDDFIEDATAARVI